MTDPAAMQFTPEGQLRSSRCHGTTRSGEQCENLAIHGAKVCRMHGAAAPQVRRKAAQRVALAEAMRFGDRRHPYEIMADALHLVDTTSRMLLERLSGGETVTAEQVQALVEAARNQAGMAKLVLDTAGGDPNRWSAQEAVRNQAESLAAVCKEFARQLGYPPDDPRIQVAFDAALDVVVYGGKSKVKTRPQAIEAEVVEF